MIIEFTGDFLQQLRGFYYVATTGSMVKAAKLMHRSQSSVSRLVRQLEQSLGVMLFSRKHDGVSLTAEGADVFDKVVNVFEQLNLIRADLSHNPGHPAGPVTFAISPLPRRYFIDPLLAGLCAALPDIHLSIQEMVGFDSILSLVRNFGVDFAIVIKNKLADDLEFTPLFLSRMVLVVPKSLGLTFEGPIGAEELRRLPHVTLPPDIALMRYISQCLPNDDLMSRHTTSNQFTQVAMAAAGYGVAISDDTTLECVLPDPATIDVHPLDHLFPRRSFGIVARKGGLLTPQARATIQFLKTHAHLD